MHAVHCREQAVPTCYRRREELAAARCEYCKRRGFKNCNGRTPCDVCIKHSTTHLCSVAPGVKPEKSKGSSTGPVREEESREQPATVKRTASKPSRRSTTTPAIVPKDHDPDEQPAAKLALRGSTRRDNVPPRRAASSVEPEEQPAQLRRASRFGSRRGNTSHRDAPVDDELDELSSTTARPRKRRKLEAGSLAQDIEQDRALVGANQDIDMSREETSAPELAIDEDEDFNIVDDNVIGISYDETTPCSTDSAADAQAASTGASSVTEDDELQSKRPKSSQQLRTERTWPIFDARPRRSLPRVSYAEVFSEVVFDEDSWVRSATEEDDASDYKSVAATDTDADDVFAVEDFADERLSFDGEMSMEEEVDDVPTFEQPATVKPKAKAKSKSSKPLAGKGIDFSRPPRNKIEDIFADMAENAVQLGLSDVLQHLKGRPLNVATMCSGTESPLLAPNLLSQGMFCIQITITHKLTIFCSTSRCWTTASKCQSSLLC
jgi:hypothetical protein